MGSRIRLIIAQGTGGTLRGGCRTGVMNPPNYTLAWTGRGSDACPLY